MSYLEDRKHDMTVRKLTEGFLVTRRNGGGDVVAETACHEFADVVDVLDGHFNPKTFADAFEQIFFPTEAGLKACDDYESVNERPDFRS